MIYRKSLTVKSHHNLAEIIDLSSSLSRKLSLEKANFHPAGTIKKADWDIFKVLTDIQKQRSDIDRAANLFTEAILSAAHESIPRARLQTPLVTRAGQTSKRHEWSRRENGRSLRTDYPETPTLWWRKGVTEKKKLARENDISESRERHQWMMTTTKTVLFVDGKPVTGNASANVFFQSVWDRVNLPQDRVRYVRQETKPLTNHKEEVSPYISDSLTMQPWRRRNRRVLMTSLMKYWST